MKKENLIAQLEGAKALSSQVDIDKVIELLNQLEPEKGLTQELADEIAGKIERSLDYNSDGFVDLDSAEIELDWNNVIRVNRVDVNIFDIMEHVSEVLDQFISEEQEPEVDSAGFTAADREPDPNEDSEEGSHHCDDLDCNCMS
jgi:hypothetical protein